MALQTSYGRDLSGASAGTPASEFGYKETYLNDEGLAVQAGIAVAYKSEGKFEFIDAANDSIVGLTLNIMDQNRRGLADDDYAPNGATCSILAEGPAYVAVEQSVTPSDPVYVRHTSDGGSNTVLGKFRKDSDSGRARLVKGARFVSSGSASNPPVMWFSRSVEQGAGDQVSAVIDHAQATADATTKVYKTHPTRHFVVERVDYINPTGLAADATNVFNIKLRNNSNANAVIANWNTLTGQNGTLTANTWVAMTLTSTAADLVLAPGSELDLFNDESGDTTLPAGKLVLHGRYV
jgi:hypothetical protein